MSWLQAVMREDLGPLVKGDTVAVSQGPRTLRLGPTYVIVRLQKPCIAQHVAGDLAGPRCSKLVRHTGATAGPKTTTNLDLIARGFVK